MVISDGGQNTRINSAIFFFMNSWHEFIKVFKGFLKNASKSGAVTGEN